MMEQVNKYADGYFGNEDEHLQHILKTIEEHGMRNISVSNATGKWLTLLATLKQSKKALEIGALGGYSGLCIARGLAEGGTLLSLELEPEYAKLAKENLMRAGYGEVVDYRIGDALTSLKQLKEDQETFDFFLIDADKERYKHYLDACVDIAEDGAVIVMDNVLVLGGVTDETVKDSLPEHLQERTRIMREYNEYVSQHPHLFSVLLPIGDGLICSIVKK